MSDYKIDPRIEPYIRALDEEGEAWRVRPSTTWHVLNDLYSQHGRELIDELLEAHWAHLRAVRRITKPTGDA